MDERPKTATCSSDTLSGVSFGDLLCVWMQPPGLCADELQQERVASGAVDHDLQGRVADQASGGFDGFAKPALDVGTGDGAE